MNREASGGGKGEENCPRELQWGQRRVRLDGVKGSRVGVRSSRANMPERCAVAIPRCHAYVVWALDSSTVDGRRIALWGS